MILIAFGCLWVGVILGICLAGLLLTSKENEAYIEGRLDEQRLQSGGVSGPWDLVA